MKTFHTVFLTVCVFVIFLGIGLFTLSHYGINWDEPVHYIRGQAFLRFFMTGKKDYNGMPRIKANYYNNSLIKIPKDVEYTNDSIFRRSIYQYDGRPNYLSFLFFKNGDDGGHPPLNGIMASFFNYVFYQKLGILGDIESYHLFIIVVSSLLVTGVFLFTSLHYGLFAGVIAAISLAVYPLFFAESHFNIKDPVETGFYSFTIFLFYMGIVKNNWRFLIGSAFCAGLALGTKFNIFFAGASLLVWLILYYWRRIELFRWPFSLQLTLSFLAFPIIMFGIVFIFWPYLWDNPIRQFFNIFLYYKGIGSISYQPNEYLIFGRLNTYAMQWILFVTPLVILFFGILGLWYTSRFGMKEKNKTSILITLWFFISIFRVSLPSSGIYGGVRQIMEYIPAMAMLSGIGAAYVVKQFSNVTIRRFLRLGILLLFVPIAFKLISIHPNENVYFNPLIGGLKGAKEKNFPDWGMTLGSVYKQGVDWINAHAEEGSKLALVRGLLQNVPPIALRRDVFFGEIYYSGPLKKGEYLMEVTDYRWTLDIPKEKREYIETLKSIYEVVVDDVPILTIWKNDFKHVK